MICIVITPTQKRIMSSINDDIAIHVIVRFSNFYGIKAAQFYQKLHYQVLISCSQDFSLSQDVSELHKVLCRLPLPGLLP